ncbi:winged helix-turn-helix transcriptional regulator [Peribacillus cavernae]|uniref:Winged helix-turn-helix transcriptional regulator n=1 Tax=Peribacillus cavernae TaxID=1674310 RepID=A0A433HWI0_9BACI|nr:winged helix-turn-helix transcriptional regulator [Peribacillus cavernae]MDQ0218189.1 repressor LexA [Peribacillus cavernae]RUQ32668.1 winged helix-turn-helix transcriptional regulator [Peribacillus cavernae]
MRNSKITKRQLEVLAAISDFINDNAFPPAQQEIADKLHISPSTVKSHLDSLKRKGYITWDEGRPRTIRILKEP